MAVNVLIKVKISGDLNLLQLHLFIFPQLPFPNVGP